MKDGVELVLTGSNILDIGANPITSTKYLAAMVFNGSIPGFHPAGTSSNLVGRSIEKRIK